MILTSTLDFHHPPFRPTVQQQPFNRCLRYFTPTVFKRIKSEFGIPKMPYRHGAMQSTAKHLRTPTNSEFPRYLKRIGKSEKTEEAHFL